MKKVSSERNVDANSDMLIIFYSFKLYICQHSKIARAYTAQNAIKKSSSLVSLGVYPRSRWDAERIRLGERRWSHPKETALERNNLTGNFSSENHVLRPRRQISTDRIPQRKNDNIYQIICINLQLSYICFCHVQRDRLQEMSSSEWTLFLQKS